MTLIPWLGAAAIGLSLGLFGSGGSILTVPVLVFLFGQAEKTAITGSLFVVGSVALAGALRRWRTGQLDWPAVALFGLPGMAGAWLGATLATGLPGSLQLAVFAVVMLLAAASMLRRPASAGPAHRRPPAVVVAGGAGVGVLTGLVGVGGGFLIVPGLTLLAGVGLRQAIGTSLVIIVLNCAVGFFRSAQALGQQGLGLDWPVLLGVTALGAAGSVAGGLLGDRLGLPSLQRGFGLLLLGMGAYVLWHSLGGAPR